MTAPRIASAGAGLRHVFLRDMVLPASIGVYPHEHAAKQRIRINIDLGVVDDALAAGVAVGLDEMGRVVDYEKIVNRVRIIAGTGHTRLAETLAEKLAVDCLTDPRVRVVRVRVEKLDVFDDTAAAGVEIERLQAG